MLWYVMSSSWYATHVVKEAAHIINAHVMTRLYTRNARLIAQSNVGSNLTVGRYNRHSQSFSAWSASEHWLVDTVMELACGLGVSKARPGKRSSTSLSASEHSTTSVSCSADLCDAVAFVNIGLQASGLRGQDVGRHTRALTRMVKELFVKFIYLIGICFSECGEVMVGYDDEERRIFEGAIATGFAQAHVGFPVFRAAFDRFDRRTFGYDAFGFLDWFEFSVERCVDEARRQRFVFSLNLFFGFFLLRGH